MSPSVLFDITFLTTCLDAPSLTGIDQVDLDYALHFSRSPATLAGVHYTFGGRPHFVEKERVAEIASRVEEFWRREETQEAESALRSIEAWLKGGTVVHRKPSRQSLAKQARAALARETRKANPLAFGRRAEIAIDGAIYLNVAQHLLQFGRFFRWLDRAPSVRSVFFVHDLMPIDYPEFWPAGHMAVFQRIVATMLRYGRGFVTSSEGVRARVEAELRRRFPATPPPVFFSHLPAPLQVGPLAPARPSLAETPYFVILGTIEPRKNHLLLLNLWRDMVAAGAQVPKLIVVGRRGWENEQVVDLLERSPLLRGHVLEAGWTPSAALRELIRNARALLMPSHAEGFGLPMVEALALGTPVLASDIAVAREATQGRAVYRHPLDGPGWREAILQLADPAADLAVRARAEAAQFRPVDRPGYFERVEAFLARIGEGA